MASTLPRIPQFVLLLVGTVLCSACTTWAPLATPAAEPVPERKLGSVRITREDLSTLVLHDAQVVRDTLSGVSPPQYSAPGAAVRIPLENVRFIERRRLDAVRTGLLVAALPVAATVLLIASFMGTGY